jgi:hypothetical protein
VNPAGALLLQSKHFERRVAEPPTLGRCPIPQMTVTIQDLDREMQIAEIMAAFDKPMSETARNFLQKTGLDYVRVVGCMKWLWLQWLSNGTKSFVCERVTAFVDDEIERLALSPLSHHRARHNLLLLQCAIFAAKGEQLLRLALQVVEASGFREFVPRNNGELYTSAWCGIFKHWILGDFERAAQQADIVWGSYRPPWLKAASKPLATPWLKQDWRAFLKAQKADFDRLWTSGRKNGIVGKETRAEIVVTVDFPVEQLWCWAHCGMALLAHRKGVEIATDPFWFPPHALECAPKDLA